jgi:hypothetical protein
MTPLRVFLAASVLLGLSACDAGGSDSATSGVWAGTAEFKVDSLLAEQNFRIITDYETRYEFELTEDENGLILGYLNQYNTGTFSIREPREGDDGQTVMERSIEWDGDLVQTWPVYGTFYRPTLELDLPQAEEAEVFPKDLWTFTVVGDRARLEATRILHGYTFAVFEDYDAPYTVVLSPTNEDEFSMRRE